MYINKVKTQESILEPQGKVKEYIVAMERYLAFFEHQYGVQVEGTWYCKRSNGDRVDNLPLITIRLSVARKYHMVGDQENMLMHAKKARQMLEHRDKSDSSILSYLAQCEFMVSSSYSAKRQLDFAALHCEQSLMFARLIKGEKRLNNEYHALNLLAIIRQKQSRLLEAIDLAEQSYILISGAYGPVHPDVQEAASELIYCLIANCDYSRADDYARMNYENLTDPRNGMDQKGPEVAICMMQIADVWSKKAPTNDEEATFALAEEAEDMARKSCSIICMSPAVMIERYSVFATVLLKRGKYTELYQMHFTKLEH
jgi:hypothetical protein